MMKPGDENPHLLNLIRSEQPAWLFVWKIMGHANLRKASSPPPGLPEPGPPTGFPSGTPPRLSEGRRPDSRSRALFVCIPGAQAEGRCTGVKRYCVGAWEGEGLVLTPRCQRGGVGLGVPRGLSCLVRARAASLGRHVDITHAVPVPKSSCFCRPCCSPARAMVQLLPRLLRSAAASSRGRPPSSTGGRSMQSARPGEAAVRAWKMM